MHIITIDGPSACGKGTIAKLVAQKLNFFYLDSGALYRIIAYIALQNNFTDENILLQLFNECKLNFEQDGIILGEVDITNEIRTEEVAQIASKLAAKENIRYFLLNWQRNYTQKKNVVADGRDMGTVVFKEAKCKIFLVADVVVRAKRRYQQLKAQSQAYNNISLEEVIKSLQQRDYNDSNREISPLVAAHDAIIIDNTYLSIKESVETVLNYTVKCLDFKL